MKKPQKPSPSTLKKLGFKAYASGSFEWGDRCPFLIRFYDLPNYNKIIEKAINVGYSAGYEKAKSEIREALGI